MGFFQNLKDDLSEAMNELIGEDILETDDAKEQEILIPGDEEEQPMDYQDKDGESIEDIDALADLIIEASKGDEEPKDEVKETAEDMVEDAYSEEEASEEFSEKAFDEESLTDFEEELQDFSEGESKEDFSEEETEEAFSDEELEKLKDEILEKIINEDNSQDAETEDMADADLATEDMADAELAAEEVDEADWMTEEMEEIDVSRLAMSDVTIENVLEKDLLLEEEKEEMEMENKMEEKKEAIATEDITIITKGTKIKGNIESDGNVELCGTVIGDISVAGKLDVLGNITGNSSAREIFAENAKINGNISVTGTVKVGQSSVILGDIEATSAVVAGAIQGNLDVHGPVILDSSAIVMGNIKSQSVQINNGAVIEGMCSQCYATVNPSSFFEEFKQAKDN